MSIQDRLEEARESPFKGKTGLTRLVNAFFHSCEGLAAAWRCESAFRQEVMLAGPMIAAAFFLHVGLAERALMIASVLMVLVVELLNSGLEAAIDHTSLDHHVFAKRAKDMGSAAVLLSLALCVAVWAVVLLS